MMDATPDFDDFPGIEMKMILARKQTEVEQRPANHEKAASAIVAMYAVRKANAETKGGAYRSRMTMAGKPYHATKGFRGHEAIPEHLLAPVTLRQPIKPKPLHRAAGRSKYVVHQGEREMRRRDPAFWANGVTA